MESSNIDTEPTTASSTSASYLADLLRRPRMASAGISAHGQPRQVLRSTARPRAPDDRLFAYSDEDSNENLFNLYLSVAGTLAFLVILTVVTVILVGIRLLADSAAK